MTPQAEASLIRARRDLDEARTIAGVGLHRLAARSAYYAAFHAAEALIIERASHRAKTHRGVHSEFARLTKDSDENDRKLWRALPDGYRYKELADYSTDPGATISETATATLIVDAVRFVARVTELLSAPAPEAGCPLPESARAPEYRSTP